MQDLKAVFNKGAKVVDIFFGIDGGGFWKQAFLSPSVVKRLVIDVESVGIGFASQQNMQREKLNVVPLLQFCPNVAGRIGAQKQLCAHSMTFLLSSLIVRDCSRLQGIRQICQSAEMCDGEIEWLPLTK